jgi:glucose-6-phosphate dehydrogenase assembly protein OpcA
MSGWLASRLGLTVPVEGHGDEPISGIEIGFDTGRTCRLVVEGSNLVLRREGQQDSYMPYTSRSLGDLLAEELRRLDDDRVYAEALGTVTGMPGLNDRSPVRQHIWWDPAQQTETAAEPA